MRSRTHSDYGYRIAKSRHSLEPEKARSERKRRQYEYAVKLLDGAIDPPVKAAPICRNKLHALDNPQHWKRK